MTTHDPRGKAGRPLRSPAEAWKIREAMLRDGFTPAEVEEALHDTGLVVPTPAWGGPFGYAVPGPAPVGHPAALPPPTASAMPTPVSHGYVPRALVVPGQTHSPLPGAATGRASYLLGFLGFLPLPFISPVIAGAAMALSYRTQRRKSALAAENARRAANWGLTYALATVAIVACDIGLSFLIDSIEESDAPLFILWLVLPLGLVHLVVTIRGTDVADQGEVFENRLAIPFLRAER